MNKFKRKWIAAMVKPNGNAIIISCHFFRPIAWLRAVEVTNIWRRNTRINYKPMVFEDNEGIIKGP